MAENLTARNLMRRQFLRLGVGHTLGDALGIFLDPHAGGDELKMLILVNPDGSFAGVLTVRYLLRALLTDMLQEKKEVAQDPFFGDEKIAKVSERLDLPVSEGMNRHVPTAAPDDRLPRLIERIGDNRLDGIPVIENDRVVGVLDLSAVFNAVTRLALASETRSGNRP